MAAPENSESHCIVSEDDAYNSASDGDFNPSNTAQVAEDGSSSSDEKSTAQHGAKRKKLNAVADADVDFENSGDEATIRKGKRRRRKDGTSTVDTSTVDLNDEEGGDGGLIKTRAQRAKEEKERKPLASAENATVDVEALWASMSGNSKMNYSTKTKSTPTTPSVVDTAWETSDRTVPTQTVSEGMNGDDTVRGAARVVADSVNHNGDNMVAIKRTYEFAGETITEEKLVPKASAEARLYFQSEQNNLPKQPKVPLRRPKKRASMFEPNPAGTVKGLLSTDDKGMKLNTIEKSKLDWAGYVDKEGIADDLDEHSRAKEGYLGRMEFLGRVEAKREEDLRSARKK